MEPEARYTLVGVIVIALVAMMVMAALWFSKSGDGSGYRYYTIYFRDHSMSGLQVDSDVTMKGIRIGTVTAVRILPTDIERPKVTLKIQGDTPISVDTLAVIRRNVLTGLAGIDLIPGNRKNEPLTLVQQGERYPIITEGKAGIEAIANSLPGVLDNANTLIVRVSNFFTDENQKNVTKILTDIEKITSALSDMSRIIDEMEGFVAKLNARSGELTNALSTTSNRLAMEASRIADSLTEASRAFATTAQQFEDPKRLILGPDKSRLGPGEEDAP